MRFLLLLTLALIAYGSLYPFDFVTRANGVAEVARLFVRPAFDMKRGDIVGNLLLFVPYGFVAVLAARAHRRPGLACLGYVVAGLVLALGLQVAQIWLRSRTPALGDAAVNAAGLLIGLALGAIALRLRPSLGDARQSAALVPLALMLAWLAYQWYPLVPTLDWQNVKNALKPLLLAPRLDPVRILATAVSWAAFFTLWGLLAAGRSSAIVKALGGLAILCGKAFIVGAGISLANLVGLGLAIIALPWLQHPRALPVLSVAILASLFLSGLQPFTPSATARDFEWIPFTGMLEGSMAINLANLLEKTFLYGAAILFMHRHGARPLPAAIGVALCLAAIEAAQVFLPGRTAESTDPVLALLLGVVMAQLSRRG